MGGETSKDEPLDESSVHAALAQTDLSERDKLREISRMDKAIRSKVRTGVQYNMKIVLCGERGVGKTALWKRFQGQTFSIAYTPTAEIQGATINWNYKSNEDNVKVEVWDVVDHGLRTAKRSLSATVGSAGYGRNNVELLDASVVDIYQGTHAVLYLLNPAAKTSLEYVRSKYKEVPSTIPILLILNFRDKIEEYNTVDSREDADASSIPGLRDFTPLFGISEVRSLCNEIRAHRLLQYGKETAGGDRERSGARAAIDAALASQQDEYCNVQVCEASMKNCFGLIHIHQYLDVPFLQLKQLSLRDQLLQASLELHNSNADMDVVIGSLDYKEYAADYAVRRARRQQNAAQKQQQTDDRISSSDLQQQQEEDEAFRASIAKSVKPTARLSTRSDREPSAADAGGSSNSPKSPIVATTAGSALKLSHSVERDKQPSGDRRSGKKSSEKKETTPPQSVKPLSAFEAEASSFRPAGAGEGSTASADDENLEALLEPSDDEKHIVSRSHIRSFSKTTSGGGSRDYDDDDTPAAAMGRTGGTGGLRNSKLRSSGSAAVESDSDEDDGNYSIGAKNANTKRAVAGSAAGSSGGVRKVGLRKAPRAAAVDKATIPAEMDL